MKREKKATPATIQNPQLLTDAKALDEVLSTVPVERIEKLKLLTERVSPVIVRALKKRIAQLEREMECIPLRERVQMINDRLARREKEVNHG